MESDRKARNAKLVWKSFLGVGNASPERQLFSHNNSPHPIIKDQSFFQSREWQRVRYAVLKKHGRLCMACGISAREVHVDHIKPRSKFPELALEITNLQVLCRACNLGKGAWDQTDWRPK